MNLSRIHEALLKSHEELLREPAAGVESLDGASCPPHVKHLAQLALSDASTGYTAKQWRAEILQGLGPDVEPLLRTAEQCMREVGLWPWHDSGRGAQPEGSEPGGGSEPGEGSEPGNATP